MSETLKGNYAENLVNLSMHAVAIAVSLYDILAFEGITFTTRFELEWSKCE